MSSTSMAAGDPWIYQSNTIPTSTFTAGSGLLVSSSATATWQNIELDLPANKDFKELADRIGEIEKQMMVLRPDLAMQEKYPALKEAYDAYQVILAIVKSKGTDEKP